MSSCIAPHLSQDGDFIAKCVLQIALSRSSCGYAELRSMGSTWLGPGSTGTALVGLPAASEMPRCGQQEHGHGQLTSPH